MMHNKNNPNAGYHKVADKFGIGRTLAEKILHTKREILSKCETSMKPGHQKSVCPTKYSDVNDALWEWYSLCRQSNIPVSGTMLQEDIMKGQGTGKICLPVALCYKITYDQNYMYLVLASRTLSRVFQDVRLPYVKTKIH